MIEDKHYSIKKCIGYKILNSYSKSVGKQYLIRLSLIFGRVSYLEIIQDLFSNYNFRGCHTPFYIYLSFTLKECVKKQWKRFLRLLHALWATLHNDEF